MVTDKNGNPIVAGDAVNLRAVVLIAAESEPDPVTGVPHADACAVVTVSLDPSDPNSPRMTFRADHLEKA